MNKASVWPNDAHLLLLKAATLQDPQASNYWSDFLKTQPDLSNTTIRQILPAVYYNLVIKQGLGNVAKLDDLKIRYFTCFANNQYISNSIIEPLKHIQKRGIPVMLIKGFAYLIQLYGGHKGARFMADIDLCVPETHFHQAAKILEAFGWMTFKCRPLKTFNPRLVHSLTYFDDQRNCIDLHCHLLHFDLNQHANQDYWEASQEILFQAIPIKTLCMTDHLLHACVHGLKLAGAPSLRWLVDIVYILNQGQIDWERLIYLAKKKHLSICLHAALSYIAQHFSAPVPSHILQQLREIPAPRFERKMFELMHTQTSFLKKQQYIFYSIYRNSDDKSWLNSSLSYLKRVAITEHLFLIPFKLPGRILWKLKDEYKPYWRRKA